MRLRNLAASIAAAGSPLALAPAGALALEHPGLHGRCKVNINVVPHLLEAGESVAVFGHLDCASRAGAANRKVRLLQHTPDTIGFRVVQSTTTDAHGFYALTTAPVNTNTTFFVRSRGAASGLRGVRVFAHVTISGPADGAALLTGAPNKVTFSGSVFPADIGAIVVLQRQNAVTGNEWHRIDRSVVGPGGVYSITHTFVVPGDANIRVLVRSQRRNVPSPSEDLTYEISQAENPELTINSSADPIAFGKSVTISGTVAGAAANTPVTLLAHTARQVGFAPVLEARTDASGNYTFAALSPIASTFYEVKSAGKVSTVLYEGVRDVLSAQVSQTTIQAGRALTFSGMVAPDHSGHVIYLEQQNRSGSGFHIVQVETVGPGSAYSIVHTVYNPGTRVFRVRIPGGPENGGAVSQPFVITVTPAPAALLKPEAPSNSTLPPEGEV